MRTYFQQKIQCTSISHSGKECLLNDVNVKYMQMLAASLTKKLLTQSLTSSERSLLGRVMIILIGFSNESHFHFSHSDSDFAGLYCDDEDDEWHVDIPLSLFAVIVGNYLTVSVKDVLKMLHTFTSEQNSTHYPVLSLSILASGCCFSGKGLISLSTPSAHFEA